MRTFAEIYDAALVHVGGESVLAKRLPEVKTSQQLAACPNALFLSTMSRRIFRAGLKHAMVDAKWPVFETVFHGFEPAYCAHLSDEVLEGLMTNTALIRHLRKLRSIRHNAQFILAITAEYGSFGEYLASWPEAKVVELWFALQKQGAQLGGSSAAQFLRMSGKDTFLLSRDVLAVLRLEGVIAGEATSKGEQRAAQQAFNQWQSESKRPLCEISRIVSLTAM